MHVPVHGLFRLLYYFYSVSDHWKFVFLIEYDSNNLVLDIQCIDF